MNKRDLKADLELCNKATPGPWEVFPPLCGPEGQTVYQVDSGGPICDVSDPYPRGDNKPQENMMFIAQAREGWPHAIERAIKAEALVREYEEVGFTPEEVMDVVRRFTSFLCEMTGGQMSKPNYTLEDMVTVADDYHQRICDESLQEEIERADKAEALARELVEALKKADQFITNGVEFGYIRLPDSDTQDSAIETPGTVRKVLAKAKEVLGDE